MHPPPSPHTQHSPTLSPGGMQPEDALQAAQLAAKASFEVKGRSDVLEARLNSVERRLGEAEADVANAAGGHGDAVAVAAASPPPPAFDSEAAATLVAQVVHEERQRTLPRLLLEVGELKAQGAEALDRMARQHAAQTDAALRAAGPVSPQRALPADSLAAYAGRLVDAVAHPVPLTLEEAQSYCLSDPRLVGFCVSHRAHAAQADLQAAQVYFAESWTLATDPLWVSYGRGTVPCGCGETHCAPGVRLWSCCGCRAEFGDCTASAHGAHFGQYRYHSTTGGLSGGSAAAAVAATATPATAAAAASSPEGSAAPSSLQPTAVDDGSQPRSPSGSPQQSQQQPASAFQPPAQLASFHSIPDEVPPSSPHYSAAALAPEEVAASAAAAAFAESALVDAEWAGNLMGESGAVAAPPPGPPLLSGLSAVHGTPAMFPTVVDDGAPPARGDSMVRLPTSAGAAAAAAAAAEPPRPPPSSPPRATSPVKDMGHRQLWRGGAAGAEGHWRARSKRPVGAVTPMGVEDDVNAVLWRELEKAGVNTQQLAVELAVRMGEGAVKVPTPDSPRMELARRLRARQPPAPAGFIPPQYQQQQRGGGGGGGPVLNVTSMPLTAGTSCPPIDFVPRGAAAGGVIDGVTETISIADTSPPPTPPLCGMSTRNRVVSFPVAVEVNVDEPASSERRQRNGAFLRSGSNEGMGYFLKHLAEALALPFGAIRCAQTAPTVLLVFVSNTKENADLLARGFVGMGTVAFPGKMERFGRLRGFAWAGGRRAGSPQRPAAAVPPAPGTSPRSLRRQRQERGGGGAEAADFRVHAATPSLDRLIAATEAAAAAAAAAAATAGAPAIATLPIDRRQQRQQRPVVAAASSPLFSRADYTAPRNTAALDRAREMMSMPPAEPYGRPTAAAAAGHSSHTL